MLEPLPADRPCLKRLDRMEEAVTQLQQALAEIRAAQDSHTDHLAAVAERHALQLGVEAQKLRDSMDEQTKNILAVTQAMVHLQQAVQRWAAAGTLAGSVVFYIVAKAAGL